jgi:DNA-binding XRE family transcriptional regulator
MALLHERLKELVEGSGLGKTDFAKAVGLSRTSLFHILKGQSLPKRSTLERFVRVTSLGGEAAGELVHLFETERIHTIQTTRKEVRSEREVFRSHVFAELEKAGECVVDESRLPDFWFGGEAGLGIPVFAEGKVTDHFNLLGRAQVLRAKAGRLKDASWRVWACVAEMEEAYAKYQEDFTPFGLRVGLTQEMAKGAAKVLAHGKKTPAPKAKDTGSAQSHFQFSIECD